MLVSWDKWHPQIWTCKALRHGDNEVAWNKRKNKNFKSQYTALTNNCVIHVIYLALRDWGEKAKKESGEGRGRRQKHLNFNSADPSILINHLQSPHGAVKPTLGDQPGLQLAHHCLPYCSQRYYHQPAAPASTPRSVPLHPHSCQ